jgi:hypothetical protein
MQDQGGVHRQPHIAVGDDSHKSLAAFYYRQLPASVHPHPPENFA